MLQAHLTRHLGATRQEAAWIGCASPASPHGLCGGRQLGFSPAKVASFWRKQKDQKIRKDEDGTRPSPFLIFPIFLFQFSAFH
jgi:hypothetical protein